MSLCYYSISDPAGVVGVFVHLIKSSIFLIIVLSCCVPAACSVSIHYCLFLTFAIFIFFKYLVYYKCTHVVHT